MQPRRLEIHLATQRLDLWEGSRIIFSAPVSTALRGPGSEPGSLRTPVGNFVIAEKIGGNQPLGTVFRSRQPTGGRLNPASADDQITSRILWLDGLDEANRNTKSRYIYLHGTNHEARLGLPESHGCIRLGNSEIVDLFTMVEVGTPLKIQ